MSHSLCVFDAWLVHIWCMVDALIDGTSWGTCWYMVDALVYGTCWLQVVWIGYCDKLFVHVWCMVDAFVYGRGWGTS